MVLLTVLVIMLIGMCFCVVERWGVGDGQIASQMPTASRSRISMAICARLAASATRLKSRRKGEVASVRGGGGEGGWYCCCGCRCWFSVCSCSCRCACCCCEDDVFKGCLCAEVAWSREEDEDEDEESCVSIAEVRVTVGV